MTKKNDGLEARVGEGRQEAEARNVADFESRKEFVDANYDEFPEAGKRILAETMDPETIDRNIAKTRRKQRDNAIKTAQEYIARMQSLGNDLQKAFRPENLEQHYTPIEKGMLYVLKHVGNETSMKKYKQRVETRVCRELHDTIIPRLDVKIKLYEAELREKSARFKEHTVKGAERKRDLFRAGEELTQIMTASTKMGERLRDLPNELQEAYQANDTARIEALEREELELVESADLLEMTKGETVDAIYAAHDEVHDRSFATEFSHQEKMLASYVLRDLRRKRQKFDYLINKRHKIISPKELADTFSFIQLTDKIESELEKSNHEYIKGVADAPQLRPLTPARDEYENTTPMAMRERRQLVTAQACNDALELVSSYRNLYMGKPADKPGEKPQGGGNKNDVAAPLEV